MGFECPPGSESPNDNIECGDLGLVRPRQSTYEGQDLSGRKRGVVVSQGQSATVEFEFLDLNGRPIRFSDCNGSSSSIAGSGDFCFRTLFREAIGTGCVTHFSAPGLLVGDSIRVALPEAMVAQAGVYEMETGALVGNKLKATDRLYVIVEPSLFGSELGSVSRGMPSLQEIRMAVRDSSPNDSYLNQEMEWDDGEIAFALIQGVAWFNEQRPPVRRKFNTQNFPYKRPWLEAVMSELYRIAAVTYRRESIQYQASGTAINDKDKANPYEEVSRQLLDKYRLWARTVKAQMNSDSAIGWT